jgi:hypothetical protein
LMLSQFTSMIEVFNLKYADDTSTVGCGKSTILGFSQAKTK